MIEGLSFHGTQASTHAENVPAQSLHVDILEEQIVVTIQREGQSSLANIRKANYLPFQEQRSH